MAEPAIRLVGVNKSYGTFHALRDIDLEVEEGERLVVCGPSGSGKSTMIRCINRLEEHDSGQIIVEGVLLSDDLDALDEVRREVGMVFQSFNLFPHLTVLENCALPRIRVRRVDRGNAQEMAMATRCCCPPDSWSGYFCACEAMRMRSSCPIAISSALRRSTWRTRIRGSAQFSSTVRTKI